MSFQAQGMKLYFLLGLAVIANFAVWHKNNHRLPLWGNVPPAPSRLGATAAFLGDEEMAYRSLAITLQSFGNNTGQVIALKDYNYPNLGTWFMLEHSLNWRSNYVPFLAGYYFGASQDPSELGPLIEYLRVVGKDPAADKWRWLGQAVFLARHRMNDMKLALSLAEELAATYKPGMPAWPLQMKAIIASDMGDKDMAYGMMLEMLQTEADTMDPIEVKFIIDYICGSILSPVQSTKDPLCKKDE